MVVWSGDSTFRGFDSERAKGIRGRLRKHGILGDRFARSSIIKRQLQRSEGNISKDYTSTDSGCLLERGKINFRSDSVRDLKSPSWVFGRQVSQEILIDQFVLVIVIFESFHKRYVCFGTII